VEKVSKQLENINKGLEKVRETLEQNKGFFQRIFDAIRRFFAWLAEILRG
jgi:nitrate reductase assembly molybdenum cofactor insertion protein NarJ